MSTPGVQVIRLPLRRMGRSTALWVSALLLIAVLLVITGRTAAVHRVAPVVASLLLLAMWGGFVSGVLDQNTRSCARLVPGHVRNLRRVLVLAWLVVALLQGCLAVALFGAGLGGPWVAAAGLLVVAMLVRWPLLWAVAWIPVVGVPWLPWSPLRWALQIVATNTLTSVMLLAAFAAPLLALLVADAGRAPKPTHAEARALWVADLWRRGGMALYHAWRRRLCARPGSSAMGRAMLVLGGQHWTGLLTAALVLAGVTAVVVAALIAFGVLPNAAFDRASLVGAAVGVLSFANPLSMAAGLQRTRGEQALLMLVPGLPRGTAFNRSLAWRLSAVYLVCWLGAGGVALGLVGLHGRNSAWVEGAVFGLLPWVALLWVDRSREPLRAAGLAWWRITAIMLSLAMLGAAVRAFDIPLPLLTVGSVCATALLLIWRHRASGAWPAAWPIGRNREHVRVGGA